MAITKVSAALVDLDGGVVINESSADADFRVESNGNANMLFVNGGTDSVGIGTASPEGLFEIEDGGTGKSILQKITLDNDDVYGLVVGNDSYSTTLADGLAVTVSNAGVVGLQARGTSSELAFRTVGAERVRIDSSGNVGIGTASPNASLDVVSDSSANGIELRGRSSDNIGQLTFESNDSGTTYSQLQSRSTELFVKTVANIPMSFHTNNTERMRIDASGRLLVGFSAAHSDTDSQSYYSKLIVKGNTYSSNTDGRIVMQNGVASTSMANDTGIGELIYTNGSGGDHAAIKAFGDGAGADNDYPGRLSFWTTADGADNPTERMRIDSTGDIRFGIANAALTTAEVHTFYNGSKGNNLGLYTQGADQHFSIDMWNHTGGSCNQVQFRGGQHGAVTGTITSTGNNATQYNTSSDYRLKENVNYTWDATTRLKQLKPAQFNWITDETNTAIDGFLAHEVSSVVRQAVTGEKDAVYEDGEPKYQGIDHSVLVPLLVKTIQELEARITTLEG